MSSKNKHLLAVVLLTLFIVSGCRSGGAPTYHINEDIDFSFYKRVAVMPLNNLTSEKYAGEIVRQVVISEILASGLVDVVVPGEVMTAVNELGIKDISTLNAGQIRSLGSALGVEALVMGSVEEYGMVKSGNTTAPQVTITLMMADTGTGTIVWSITKSQGGAGFMARHFGARHATVSETVLKLVRESIKTLAY